MRYFAVTYIKQGEVCGHYYVHAIRADDKGELIGYLTSNGYVPLMIEELNINEAKKLKLDTTNARKSVEISRMGG